MSFLRKPINLYMVEEEETTTTTTKPVVNKPMPVFRNFNGPRKKVKVGLFETMYQGIIDDPNIDNKVRNRYENIVVNIKAFVMTAFIGITLSYGIFNSNFISSSHDDNSLKDNYVNIIIDYVLNLFE